MNDRRLVCLTFFAASALLTGCGDSTAGNEGGSGGGGAGGGGAAAIEKNCGDRDCDPATEACFVQLWHGDESEEDQENVYQCIARPRGCDGACGGCADPPTCTNPYDEVEVSTCEVVDGVERFECCCY